MAHTPKLKARLKPPNLSEPVIIRNRCSRETVITDTGLALLEYMAANGAGLAHMAKALGIDRKTLRRHRREHEAVRDAIEIGHECMETELVDILMTKARDRKNPQGLTAAMFLLKSRRGYEVGQQKVPTHLVINQDNSQKVILASPDSMAEYLKRVQSGDGTQSISDVDT